MSTTPEITIDLARPPEERWEQLVSWRAEARELLRFYVRDIGGVGTFSSLLSDFRDLCVDVEYAAEIRGIARLLDVSEHEVLLANLYYDALKIVMCGGMGCTAFAVDTPRGPIHARNLDWMSADGKLASGTMVVYVHRGKQALYRMVGWPGFVGCLSGVAPGRFAVTLNAVLSHDSPELAPPIAFVLRRVLETADSFDTAVQWLCAARVASDSLLLVSGAHAGEMIVIERAPTRAAVRGPYGGSVVVTNDYRALHAKAQMENAGELAETSCSRFTRATTLIRERAPQDESACLAILRDARVKMDITVQHIVFSAAEGGVMVAFP